MFHIHLSRSIAIDIKVKPDTQLLKFLYTNHKPGFNSFSSTFNQYNSASHKIAYTMLDVILKTTNQPNLTQATLNNPVFIL